MTSYSIGGSSSRIDVYVNDSKIGTAKSVEVKAHVEDEDDETAFGVITRGAFATSFDVKLAMDAEPKPGVDEDDLDAAIAAPSTATYPFLYPSGASSGGSPGVTVTSGGSSPGWPSSTGMIWHTVSHTASSHIIAPPETLEDLVSELIIDDARLVWHAEHGEWRLELDLRHTETGAVVSVTLPFRTPLVINDLIDALETYAEETE